VYKTRRSSDLDPMPEPPGDDERIAGPEGVALVAAWSFDHDRHLPRQQIDQLVAVGVALAEMRWCVFEAGDRQQVAVDARWRTG